MDQLWAPWRMAYILEAKEGSTDNTCIFCEKPKQQTDEENLIVHRSDECFVMLNKFPYNNGHLMIVPYLHESDLTKLSEQVTHDMHRILNMSITAVRKTMEPHGMNIGLNLGQTAGAGIVDHLHYHLVPRWNGDTNFMPVISGTKVISEALSDTWRKLHTVFKGL
jgi:ATP adenylyltransferase